jgi:hypothetical protein
MSSVLTCRDKLMSGRCRERGVQIETTSSDRLQQGHKKID